MEEIIKKLDSLDTKVEKIVQRLDGHDQKFDEHDNEFKKVNKKLEEHDDKFERVFQTLDEHTEQLDIIARTVAEHTERFDRMEDKLNTMATKDDISKIMNVLDDIVGLTKKYDEEIVVINHNHRMLDHRVEVLEQKI